MKNETKIYSEFIKRNTIIVKGDTFIFCYKKSIIVCDILKNGNKWAAGNDDNCHTKKAAIYYHIKNNYETLNGILL